jgi:hypothetical protein
MKNENQLGERLSGKGREHPPRRAISERDSAQLQYFSSSYYHIITSSHSHSPLLIYNTPPTPSQEGSLRYRALETDFTSSH